MYKNINVEAEHNELILKNSNGDHAIIPANKRTWVKHKLAKQDYKAIDELISTLPVATQYANDGTIIPLNNDKNLPITDKEPIVDLPIVTVETKAPKWLKDKRTLESKFDLDNPANSNEYIKNFRKDIAEKLEKERQIRKESFVKKNLEAIKSSGPNYNKEDDDFDKSVLKERNILKEKKINLDYLEDLSSISKEDLKNIQRFLSESGYLNSEKTDISTLTDVDSIKAVQKKLIKKGFDIGNYGIKKDGVDGILGKKTLEAIEKWDSTKEIDGLLGEKTFTAFKNFKLDSTKFNENLIKDLKIPEIKSDEDIPKIQTSLKEQGYLINTKEDFDFNVSEDITARQIDSKFRFSNEDICTSKECTYFVGQEIQNKVSVKGREKIGAYGDAWTIIDNMKASDNQEVFNVFPKNKPSIKNPDAYMDKITKDNLSKLSDESFNDGDIIGLYYGGSPSLKQAYNESSRTFSTHSGIVKLDKDGNKFIEHNISGKIHREPISQYLNDEVRNANGKPIRVTAIIRPDYNKVVDADVYDSTEYSINFDNVKNPNTAFGKKEAAEFGQFLVNNKDVIVEDFPITEIEYDKLAKAAKSIGFKESYFQANPKTKTKSIGSDIRERIGIRESSKGFTQLKDEENFDAQIRKNLGITDKLLETPSGSALATIYALGSRYITIKNKILNNTNLKFTTDEMVQLSLIAWNQPLHKVLETIEKRQNFEKTLQSYRDAYGYSEKGESKFPYELALTSYNKYLTD